MTEKSTVLNAIRLLFSAAETTAEVAPASIMETTDETVEKFIDVVTQDGITLRVAEMAVGVPCYHVDSEGVETLCEDGAEYVLEDGTKISIGAEGLIAEIEAPEAEEAEVEVEMGDKKDKQMYAEETETEAPAEVTEQAFASVSEIETLRQANVLLAEELDALRAEFQAFAKAPSAEALSTSTKNNVGVVAYPTTREERLAFFGKK
jgi:hypothetical protein